MDTSKVDYESWTKELVSRALFDPTGMTEEAFTKFFYAIALAHYNRFRTMLEPKVGTCFVHSPLVVGTIIPSNVVVDNVMFDTNAVDLFTLVNIIPNEKADVHKLGVRLYAISDLRATVVPNVLDLKNYHTLGLTTTGNVDWAEVRRSCYGSFRLIAEDPTRGELSPQHRDFYTYMDQAKLGNLVEELPKEVADQLRPGLLPLFEFLHMTKSAGAAFYSKNFVIVGINHYFAQIITGIERGWQELKNPEFFHSLLASAFPIQLIAGTVLRRNKLPYDRNCHFGPMGVWQEGELLYVLGPLSASTSRDAHLGFTTRTFLAQEGHCIERYVVNISILRTLKELFDVVRTTFDLETKPCGEPKTVPPMPELVQDPNKSQLKDFGATFRDYLTATQFYTTTAATTGTVRLQDVRITFDEADNIALPR